MPDPRATFRCVLIAILAATVSACASDPWREAYVASGPQPLTPSERADLVLVEFEQAVPQRELEGHEVIGHASFTGRYSREVERRLRRFATEVGADRVAWGARYLHTERSTTLQPTFETFDSRTRGEVYDPRTGRYVDDVDLRTQTTRTRHVPVVDDNAYYAFRAVFYRDASGGDGAD